MQRSRIVADAVEVGKDACSSESLAQMLGPYLELGAVGRTLWPFRSALRYARESNEPRYAAPVSAEPEYRCLSARNQKRNVQSSGSFIL